MTKEEKAIEQHFPVVYGLLCETSWLSFLNLGEILNYEWPFKLAQMNRYRAVLSCGTVYYAVHCGQNLKVINQMKVH